MDAVLQNSDEQVKKRIAEQGISTDGKTAREQCLAMLGLKDRTKEARA